MSNDYGFIWDCMEKKIVKLAICSPSQNAYSETFIQSHRCIPNISYLFYHDSSVPRQLEGKGLLVKPDLVSRIIFKLRHKIQKRSLTEREYAIYRSLKKHRIQCVLAEYGTSGVGLMKVCNTLGIPLVVHFHGFDASIHDVLDRYKSSYKSLFDIAVKVVVVSEVMKKRLLELGLPEDKAVKNIYGPDSSFFNIQSRFDGPRFVAIGRFVDKKAPYYLLLSFHKVLQTFPNADLVIAGDGPLKNTCINLAIALGVRDSVSFPGILKREEFQQLLCNTLAFLQHSITAINGDMEGAPNSILEASAAGIPVIATKHAGIPEVVEHGITGLLVDEHDWEGMANHMCTLLVNTGLAKNMGKAGRQRIGGYFTQERYLKQLSDIIHNAVNVADGPH